MAFNYISRSEFMTWGLSQLGELPAFQGTNTSNINIMQTSWKKCSITYCSQTFLRFLSISLEKLSFTIDYMNLPWCWPTNVGKWKQSYCFAMVIHSSSWEIVSDPNKGNIALSIKLPQKPPEQLEQSLKPVRRTCKIAGFFPVVGRW